MEFPKTDMNSINALQIRRDITNEIYIGNLQVSAGQLVSIEKIDHAYRQVCADLSCGNVRYGPFGFRAIVAVGNAKYVVVEYDQDVTAESDTIPVVVLEIRDQRTLQTITPKLVEQLTEAVVDAMLASQNPPVSQFEAVFGPIPEVTK